MAFFFNFLILISFLGMSRIGGKFVIDCRRPTAAYFPDPEDCRNFYHCSDWTGLQKKSCGNSLYFNPQNLNAINILKVIASCRSPDKSADLVKLLDKHGQPPAIALDTTNPASLLKFVSGSLSSSQTSPR